MTTMANAGVSQRGWLFPKRQRKHSVPGLRKLNGRADVQNTTPVETSPGGGGEGGGGGGGVAADGHKPPPKSAWLGRPHRAEGNVRWPTALRAAEFFRHCHHVEVAIVSDYVNSANDGAHAEPRERPRSIAPCWS